MQNITARSQQIKEIQVELGMRRKVWRRVPGSTDQFMEQELNRRYQALRSTELILEAMTDKEFAEIVARLERKDTENKAQMSLEF